MPYSKATIPPDHTEFGGGPGLIDPVMRADRNLLPEQELLEIYATDQSGGVAATGSTPAEMEINRKLSIERSKPENAILERP